MSKKYDLSSDDGITAFIASLKRRGESLQQDFHAGFIAVASKWARDGDCRMVPDHINGLIEALPGMSRKNAAREWVEFFMGLVWNKDESLFVIGNQKNGKHLSVKDKDGATVLDRAKAKPFWEFKKEAEYKPLDFEAELDRLIARAQKRLKEGVTDKDKVSNEVVARAIKAKVEIFGDPAPASTDGKTTERPKVTPEKVASAA